MVQLTAANRALIGFIGLGNMGAHMARNLIKRGHELIVYDVNTQAVKDLGKAGKQTWKHYLMCSLTIDEVPDCLLKALRHPRHLLRLLLRPNTSSLCFLRILMSTRSSLPSMVFCRKCQISQHFQKDLRPWMFIFMIQGGPEVLTLHRLQHHRHWGIQEDCQALRGEVGQVQWCSGQWWCQRCWECHFDLHGRRQDQARFRHCSTILGMHGKEHCPRWWYRSRSGKYPFQTSICLVKVRSHQFQSRFLGCQDLQ